ncbi:unnamed protein product [Malus baccata var. baccata]
MIWDTFAFEEVTFHRLILELGWRVFWFPPEVVDVSARVLLRLSPHASLYPSHLPYLFLRQMRYLPWKHKMLNVSTREQCQYSLFAEVLSGGKKAEYFKRLRWECPLRYEERLSIFAGLPVRWGWRSTYIGVSLTTSSNAIPLPCLVIARLQTSFIQGDPALEVGKVVPLRFSNKQSCRGSGSRDSENDASSIFDKAILLGVWLSRFGERCLFDFLESNHVGSLALEIRKAVPL